MGHRKNFFKIYRQFGRVPSESLPALTEYHEITALLIHTDIKMPKDMVLIVYSVVIQYYMFHSAPISIFPNPNHIFYNKHVETCCHPGPVPVVQIEVL
jgi:hypothetical protein